MGYAIIIIDLICFVDWLSRSLKFLVSWFPLSCMFQLIPLAGCKRPDAAKVPKFPSVTSNIAADLAKILTDKSFFHKQYIDLCQLAIVSFKQV